MNTLNIALNNLRRNLLLRAMRYQNKLSAATIKLLLVVIIGVTVVQGVVVTCSFSVYSILLVIVVFTSCSIAQWWSLIFCLSVNALESALVEVRSALSVLHSSQLSLSYSLLHSKIEA